MPKRMEFGEVVFLVSCQPLKKVIESYCRFSVSEHLNWKVHDCRVSQRIIEILDRECLIRLLQEFID